ncbi:hypothetical protein BJX65DRAFT_305428 [Aspergillus insuetus]
MVKKIRSAIIAGIEKEIRDPRSGALRDDVDPTPVNYVKDRLQLVIQDDPSRYDGLDEAGVREILHAWCYPSGEQVFIMADIIASPDASMVQTWAGLPVSECVCLMVDEEVMQCVDGDLKNGFGEGPYVKGELIGRADNQGDIDQFLPPKRRKTGERPIYNGYWPEDVEMEPLVIDPDEIPALERALGHASEESTEDTESQCAPTACAGFDPFKDFELLICHGGQVIAVHFIS